MLFLNRKGQASLEYLLTTSFLLMVTGIIFSYALFVYGDTVSNSTANTAVQTIINTVDQVYALGPETVLFVDVDLPNNIQQALTQDAPQQTALVLKLQSSAGLADVIGYSKTHFSMTPLTTQALQREGRYRLKVFWNNGTQNVLVCTVDDTGGCQGEA